MSQVSGLSRRFQLDVGAANDLAVAAQRVGLETESVGAAVGRMNLTLGKAAEGSGEAIGAFARLGLNFRDLSTMGVDEALAKIGDKLNAMGSQAERTAAAQAIFGKGWAEIDPLLRGGSRALEQAHVAAARFGLTVSQMDLTNLKSMKQSGRDVGMAFEGLSLTIVRH